VADLHPYWGVDVFSEPRHCQFLAYRKALELTIGKWERVESHGGKILVRWGVVGIHIKGFNEQSRKNI